MSLTLDGVIASAGDTIETVELSPDSLAVLFFAFSFLEKRANWLDTAEDPLDEVTDTDWDTIEKIVGNAAYELMNPVTLKYPEIVYIDPIAAQEFAGGSISRAANANMINGFIIGVTPVAQNNAMSWQFFARKGTYLLTILTITSSAYGRITPRVDGVDNSDYIELYAASTTYNVLKTINVVVPTDGSHYIALQVKTKHASSTGYNMFVSDLWLYRVGN